jgi:hypothetical protein
MEENVTKKIILLVAILLASLSIQKTVSAETGGTGWFEAPEVQAYEKLRTQPPIGSDALIKLVERKCTYEYEGGFYVREWTESRVESVGRGGAIMANDYYCSTQSRARSAPIQYNNFKGSKTYTFYLTKESRKYCDTLRKEWVPATTDALFFAKQRFDNKSCKRTAFKDFNGKHVSWDVSTKKILDYELVFDKDLLLLYPKVLVYNNAIREQAEKAVLSALVLLHGDSIKTDSVLSRAYEDLRNTLFNATNNWGRSTIRQYKELKEEMEDMRDSYKARIDNLEKELDELRRELRKSLSKR